MRGCFEAVEPDELKTVMAIDGKSIEPQERVVSLLDDETGAITHFSIPGSDPFSRTTLAAIELVGDAFVPAMMRSAALAELLSDPRAAPFVRKTENGEFEVAEIMVEVAARHPFDPESGFVRKPFFAAVRKLQRSMTKGGCHAA